jgi:hypothetical protein
MNSPDWLREAPYECARHAGVAQTVNPRPALDFGGLVLVDRREMAAVAEGEQVRHKGRDNSEFIGLLG